MSSSEQTNVKAACSEGSNSRSRGDSPTLRSFAASSGFEPSAIALFEGQLRSGLKPRGIAKQAWDFETINARYAAYIAMAKNAVKRLRAGQLEGGVIRKLAKDDRRHWWAAVRIDPLLPSVLHPPGYQGATAWKSRKTVALELARAFTKGTWKTTP